MNTKKVALITGASSGIGKEFATIHAEKGKLNVISGLTFAQKLMMASIPFTPKKMVLSQVRKMQEV